MGKLKLVPFSLNNPGKVTNFTNELCTEIVEAVAMKLKVDNVELDTTFYVINLDVKFLLIVILPKIKILCILK